MSVSLPVVVLILVIVRGVLACSTSDSGDTTTTDIVPWPCLLPYPGTNITTSNVGGHGTTTTPRTTRVPVLESSFANPEPLLAPNKIFKRIITLL
eukprot:1220322-Rhodomonas_salina.1